MTQASTLESSEAHASLADSQFVQTIQVSKPVRNCAKDIVPKHDWVSMTAVVAVCVMALWAVLGQSAAIQITNRKIAYLQQSLLTTQATNASLLAHEQLLVQPSRILNIASTRLHMHIARPLTISSTGH